MKLSHVIKKLEENPKLKFKSKSSLIDGTYSLLYVEYVGSKGYYIFKRYQKDGTPIDSYIGGGTFTENVIVSGEWEQVPEAVGFMTAINSGKCIKPITAEYYDYRQINYWCDRLSTCDPKNTIKVFNGQWEVEP